MTAYAGRCTFTGEKVVHHVEAASTPNDVGTDLTRLVKLDGDRLTLLVAKPYLRGGIMVRSQELIWKRLFGCSRSEPSQDSVPADLTLASDLAFVFNASRVRLSVASTH
jgi:hypothetical protein